MNIFKYLNMLAAALALSAGITYAQDDCGCDSGCVEDSKPKYVALSFDDGPSLKFTPMMLDVLEENGVKRLVLPDRPEHHRGYRPYHPPDGSDGMRRREPHIFPSESHADS